MKVYHLLDILKEFPLDADVTIYNWHNPLKPKQITIVSKTRFPDRQEEVVILKSFA